MQSGDREAVSRVKVRDFVKDLAHFLDRVQFDGLPIVLVRNGREAVMLTPMSAPSRIGRGRSLDPAAQGGVLRAADMTAVADSFPDKEEILKIDLDEPKAVALRRLAIAWPRRLTGQFTLREFSGKVILQTLAALKWDGLIASIGGGYEPTPFGLRVARYHLMHSEEQVWREFPADDANPSSGGGAVWLGD